MNITNVNTLLNDLLVELHRSLLQYVSEAWPWTSGHSESLRNVVIDVARNQREDVRRLVQLLRERGHAVDLGVYPVEYMSLNYLALEFIFVKLREQQQNLVRWVESLIPALEADQQAQQLVKGIAAAEQAALNRFRELGNPSQDLSTPWMK